MIEPELAFADLEDNMECAEAYLKYCVSWALKNCSADIAWFDKNIEEGLIERLHCMLKHSFQRVSYTEAVSILQQHQDAISLPLEWGDDLKTEHERFLAEVYYKKPVIVYDYPKDLKVYITFLYRFQFLCNFRRFI